MSKIAKFTQLFLLRNRNLLLKPEINSNLDIPVKFSQITFFEFPEIYYKARTPNGFDLQKEIDKSLLPFRWFVNTQIICEDLVYLHKYNYF